MQRLYIYIFNIRYRAFYHIIAYRSILAKSEKNHKISNRMEIKHNIHLNRIISTIAMLLCICWMPVCAQIRIVDEQDGKPVAGAYIFSSDNHLLCISDSKGNIEPQSGMITISNVAYESKTIDA